MWSEGRALTGAPDVLSKLEAAGLETAGIAERIDSPGIAALLDANTDEAAERGVFGAPTMFVGDVMFFGNDRLEFVREELARQEDAA